MSDTRKILGDIVVPKPKHLGDGSWKIVNRTPITVIFGKNGSGKSLLLRGIRDQDNELYNYSVPERAGNIAYQINRVPNQVSGNTRASQTSQNFHPQYREDVISRIQAFLSKRGASRKTIDSESLNEIETQMRDLLSDFEFKFTETSPPFSLKRITGEAVGDVSLMSSGEAEMFSLGLELLLICNIWKLNDTEGTLLIDEPDTHIHPDLQQRLANFLINLHQNYHCPLIIATHSTTLLAGLGFYGGINTSVIYLDNNEEEQKTIQFDKYLETMSTCLGGHALMGPLFSFPLLLVEGDDDFRIWSELPRRHQVQISVIPCNGNEIMKFQKTLEKLFSSITDATETSSGYVLLDCDKSKPQSQQNHIKFLQLQCHESENLYLTDENLTFMKLNWEQACEKVIEQSVNYGEKENELKTIKTWDRKNYDCKNIIKEVAKILDEKNLHWTHRLGITLSNQKPTGQLAEFLGKEIIDTLWKR